VSGKLFAASLQAKEPPGLWKCRKRGMLCKAAACSAVVASSTGTFDHRSTAENADSLAM
jgi:hypothetical protein